METVLNCEGRQDAGIDRFDHFVSRSRIFGSFFREPPVSAFDEIDFDPPDSRVNGCA